MGNIKLNGITPVASKIKLGSQSVSKIYAGDTLVWGGTFNENLGYGAFTSLRSIKILPDGNFFTYAGLSSTYLSNNISYLHVAKYNSDGVLDTNFASNTLNGPITFNYVSSSANLLAIHPDGESALICGRGNGDDGGYKLLKINSDGTYDTTFNNNAKFTSDAGRGNCVVTSGQDIYLYVDTLAFGLVKFNQEGVQDTSFPSIYANGGTITSMIPLDNGGFLLAGSFSDINSIANTSHLAKINPDGTVDTAFASNWGNLVVGNAGDNAIKCMAIGLDGSIFIGGFFHAINVPVDGGNTLTINYILKLNSDGTVNSNFSSNMGRLLSNDVYGGDCSQIKIIPNLVDGDYKVLLGGDFFRIAKSGIPSVYPQRMTKVMSNGFVDSSFYLNQSTISTYSLGFNDEVESFDIQEDGKIITVGAFDKLHNVDRPKIARLTSDGYSD